MDESTSATMARSTEPPLLKYFVKYLGDFELATISTLTCEPCRRLGKGRAPLARTCGG